MVDIINKNKHNTCSYFYDFLVVFDGIVCTISMWFAVLSPYKRTFPLLMSLYSHSKSLAHHSLELRHFRGRHVWKPNVLRKQTRTKAYEVRIAFMALCKHCPSIIFFPPRLSTVCNCDLARSGFFQKKGEYICTADYQRLYGTRCDRCNSFITGEVVSALGRTYHPKCFVCSVCRSAVIHTHRTCTNVDKWVWLG